MNEKYRARVQRHLEMEFRFQPLKKICDAWRGLQKLGFETQLKNVLRLCVVRSSQMEGDVGIRDRLEFAVERQHPEEIFGATRLAETERNPRTVTLEA